AVIADEREERASGFSAKPLDAALRVVQSARQQKPDAMRINSARDAAPQRKTHAVIRFAERAIARDDVIAAIGYQLINPAERLVVVRKVGVREDAACAARTLHAVFNRGELPA